MKTDVLIIGGGGAGLVAALHAHQNGSKVKVLTKEYPTRSQTTMAQGGINAVLDESEDSIATHIQNTLHSSHNLASPQSVEFLCKEAPSAIKWLDSIGVCFSRTKDAKIAQRKLGGASYARACYAQDYTGLKILHTLYDRCIAEGIEILAQKYLLDIDTHNGSVCGVSILDIRTSEVEYYSAKSVVLATGGYARVYDKYSTNSKASSGDGIAAALRAGVALSDMEFVQFHPTALKNSSILIGESARGAGGHLLNEAGERFTNELAPRDEVARAIDLLIRKGENVFLDIRHLGEKFIDEELPQERKLAKLYENVDPTQHIIPIKPVAHYTMGGIVVDENSQTNIEGLFSVGECANHKVHGANRLGGNSLLELVVFAKKVGFDSAMYAKTHNFITHNFQTNRIEQIKQYTNEIDFYEIQHEIGELFYKNVGIRREEKTLQSALQRIQAIKQDIPKMGVSDRSKVYNTNLIEFLEFINIVELAEVVVLSALQRQESRGAHFREDFQKEDKAFQAHSIVSLKENNAYGVKYED